MSTTAAVAQDEIAADHPAARISPAAMSVTGKCNIDFPATSLTHKIITGFSSPSDTLGGDANDQICRLFRWIRTEGS
jgi:hypothetical protein